jgi:hypothetical protein
MTAAQLAMVLFVAAHSRSEGTSRFVVAEDGRVDVVVTLTSPDVPELCDADLAIVDPARHAVAEQKVSACVEQGLPRWLRLRIDAEACDVLAGSWRRDDGYAIALKTQASCPPPRGRALTIDWGLFHDSPLEHVSTATVVLPGGVERRTLFSRRHSRVVIDVPGPAWRRALPAVLAVLALLALLGVVGAVAGVVARRRRQRSEQAR